MINILESLLFQLDMASMIAKATGSSCSSQMSLSTSAPEKGSRNKRKYRADPPSNDVSKGISLSQNDCMSYEFTAEKFGVSSFISQTNSCDLRGINQGHSNGLTLDLGLVGALDAPDIGPSNDREGLLLNGLHDVDWSDPTESQLEELILNNLDAIFRSAIKRVVASGYSEEVATEAVLRSGLCYGCKDTVSNIVDNTLAFLRTGREVDPSREHCFEDLQHLERYVLAELVCVLREVRPFFSTGDAMWCLLICDMNISLACAMECDSVNRLPVEEISNGIPSMSSHCELKVDRKNNDVGSLEFSKPMLAAPFHSSPEASIEAVVTVPKPINSSASCGLVSEKEALNSVEHVDKSSTVSGTSHSPVADEKIFVRKVYSGSAKRDSLVRHKTPHLEKSYRIYGSKGSKKVNNYGGLMLDKKLRSVSESTSVSIRNASLRLSRTLRVDMPPDNLSLFPGKTEPDSPASVKSEPPQFSSVSTIQTQTSSVTSDSLTLSTDTTTPQLSAGYTELSLPLTSKQNSSVSAEVPNTCFSGIAHENSSVPWYTPDKKDDCIAKLLPRIRELQNQLQEWKEWANQKVMQAARRLSKDKEELLSLRKESKEVERLKKEKQTWEENTMKKLSEMENALFKTGGQVERHNSEGRRLEMENATLRQEMEAAKVRAAESAASCQEAAKREKKTLMKFKSWEKQKLLLQEELTAEKHKVEKLLKDLDLAKQQHEQQEARRLQEEKEKDGLVLQAASIRKKREELEITTRSKENAIKLKAETNMQKYKDDIQRLEREIAQLRLKADSSKIAALRRGIDGSYASRLTDGKSNSVTEDWTAYISELVTDLQELSEKGVKRERECVMCLSEEMSVVFLPCAHQVVCTTCNELHEKRGMKDCPSCRGPIHRRIPVRYIR